MATTKAKKAKAGASADLQQAMKASERIAVATEQAMERFNPKGTREEQLLTDAWTLVHASVSAGVPIVDAKRRALLVQACAELALAFDTETRRRGWAPKETE